MAPNGLAGGAPILDAESNADIDLEPWWINNGDKHLPKPVLGDGGTGELQELVDPPVILLVVNDNLISQNYV